MDRASLRDIVATVLECEAHQLRPEQVLAELENYDSVNILSLMVALDDEAGIKLDHTDLSRMVCYRDIETIVQAKGVPLDP